MPSCHPGSQCSTPEVICGNSCPQCEFQEWNAICIMGYILSQLIYGKTMENAWKCCIWKYPINHSILIIWTGYSYSSQILSIMGSNMMWHRFKVSHLTIAIPMFVAGKCAQIYASISRYQISNINLWLSVSSSFTKSPGKSFSIIRIFFSVHVLDRRQQWAQRRRRRGLKLLDLGECRFEWGQNNEKQLKEAKNDLFHLSSQEY